jgi:2-keto-4-pentenoate hydratase
MRSESVIRATDTLLAIWRERISAGDGRLGWKIGINDPAMQRRLGLEESVVGALFESGEIRPGRSLAVSADAQIGVEAEIAIDVAEDVAGGASLEAVGRALAGFGPALEVVDLSRLTGDVAALVADNILHVGVRFSGPGPVRAGTSLHGLAVEFACGDEEPRRALPSDVLGDLATVAKLVADTLAAHGETLRAGDRIISGALTPPLRLAPGRVARADFGALGVLSVARPEDGPPRIEAR